MTRRPFNYDPVVGAFLRDEGMARALANAGDDWGMAAHHFVRQLPEGWEGTAEDARLWAMEQGLEKPRSGHWKAWGPVTRQCVEVGLLVATGKRRQMIAPDSHARDTDVYRRTEKH